MSAGEPLVFGDAPFRLPARAAAWHDEIMANSQRPQDILSIDDAVLPTQVEPTADVLEWQRRKIARGLKAADEGRFASPETIRAVIQKLIPNG